MLDIYIRFVLDIIIYLILLTNLIILIFFILFEVPLR